MIISKTSTPIVRALQLTFCVTALSSCGFLSAGQKALSSLKQGMSTEQVKALAGMPQSRNVKENGEELWKYDYPYESMSLYLKFRENALVSFGSKGETVDQSFIPPPVPVPPPAPERPPVVVVDRPTMPGRPTLPERPTVYPSRPGEVVFREAELRAFEEFCRSLRHLRYPEERLEALREVVPFSYFSTYQAIRLLELFDRDQERLALLADLASHLIDPQHARELLRLFLDRQSQAEALRILDDVLNRPSEVIYGRYARQMQEDFERFYQTVKRQHFSDDQIRYLEVGATERLFTVDQAKRLINLFTWGDSKLKALRLLASNLVDGYNAYLLLDCFDVFDKEKAQQVLRLAKRRPRYLRPSRTDGFPGYGRMDDIFD